MTLTDKLNNWSQIIVNNNVGLLIAISLNKLRLAEIPLLENNNNVENLVLIQWKLSTVIHPSSFRNVVKCTYY